MRRLLTLLTLAFVLAPIPAAQAQNDEPGVYADPDAPAGKEYAIPLEQARRESSGSGDHKQRRRSTSSAQAFGAGVTPQGSSGNTTTSQSSTTSSDTGTTSHPRRKKKSAKKTVRQAKPEPITPAAVRAASQTDDSAGIRIGGIVAAVLLVGALLGLVARRVLRSG